MAINSNLAGWPLNYALGIFLGMVAFKVYDRFFR
jgi:hypothetical protein